MEPARADSGWRWKALVWRVAVVAGVTLAVAALGAFVGWMLGSALTGIIFGAPLGPFVRAFGRRLLRDNSALWLEPF